jgi:FlaA1/EpsC-like NDP-sugar epimerase
LVLQGFAIGNHGDTLLLDMGEPVRILDLARTLIRLSGKSEREVGIRFTGLRDGEKLFEELSYPAEEIHPTSSPKISQIRGTPHHGQDLKRQLGQLNIAMSGKRAAAIRAKMKEIVPEYTNGLYDLPEDAGILARPGAATSRHFSSAKWNSSDSTRYPTPRL